MSQPRLVKAHLVSVLLITFYSGLMDRIGNGDVVDHGWSAYPQFHSFLHQTEAKMTSTRIGWKSCRMWAEIGVSDMNSLQYSVSPQFSCLNHKKQTEMQSQLELTERFYSFSLNKPIFRAAMILSCRYDVNTGFVFNAFMGLSSVVFHVVARVTFELECWVCTRMCVHRY